MMKKVITFILVLAMVLSVSSVALAVDVDVTDTSTAQSALNTAADTYNSDTTINLADGNYEELKLKANLGTKGSTGTGVTSDPYTMTSTISSLVLNGTDSAKVAGFGISIGFRTIYPTPNPAYYINQYYDIGTLKLSGMTFINSVNIHNTGFLDIDNLVFENVTFDMSGKTMDAAAHIISSDGGIDNITFTNCTFKGCSGIEKPIAIDCRTTDDVNITIEGCKFDAASFNAIQISGTGSKYTGTINIKNNEISNTEDRGIRISTADGTVNIEGNIMKNATDDANEAIKIGGAAKITVANNTLDGEPISESAVIAEDAKAEGKLTITFEEPNPSDPGTSTPENKPSGSGISVKYNGGNSFSTSNPAVPTGVEIDGVAVPFSGTGSNFTVGCVDPGAKWVTVRWNSTSVTTNFTPDALVECSVSIPKTGDMPVWAAVLALFGF